MVGAVPYSALRFAAYDGLKILYRRVRHCCGNCLAASPVVVLPGNLAGCAFCRGSEATRADTTACGLVLPQRFGEDLPPHVLVAAGALAGLAASTATFPLEVRCKSHSRPRRGCTSSSSCGGLPLTCKVAHESAATTSASRVLRCR